MDKPEMMGIGGYLRCISQYLRPYRRTTALIVLAMLVDIGFATGLPVSFKLLIDKALVPRDTHLLALILSGLAVAGVLASVSGLGRDFLYARLGTSVLNDLRLRMFSHLQRLSSGFYARTEAGDLISRFSNDLASVEWTVVNSIPTAFMSSLQIILSLAVLFALEWRLATVALVGTILCFRGAHVLEPRASEASYRMKEEQAEITARFQENLLAQPVVKGFGLHAMVVARFNVLLGGYLKTATRANTLSYVVERIPNAGVTLLGLVVVAVGAWLAYRGDMSVGDLVAFNGLFVSLAGSVEGVTCVIPELIRGASGMQRVQEILDEVPQVGDRPGAGGLPPLSQEIAFRDVSFSYTGERRNLEAMTLTIPQGASVAFVGPSGSGKSTVLNLVMRFYDPTEGTVTIDSTDLRAVGQDSLRAQMGIVFQENFLFNTTICENIRLGRPDASDAEVEEAAKKAGIHDFIETLPEGYNTLAGERGGRFSGGQRQRVGIARAILRDPRILVLDEATSALDPATEAAVNETLRSLGKGRTVLSVTHRLAPVVHADRIFVLDQGRLAEEGRHEDLLARKGLYANLWSKQSGFHVSEEGDHARVTDIARLRQIPIAATLDDAILEQVARLFVTERYHSGRVIIQEGDPGDKFYILVRGRVAVTRALPDGREQHLATLEDGDHFGEIALLQDVPRTATVKALANSVLLSLQRAQFLEIIEQAPDLRAALEAVVLTRMDAPQGFAAPGTAR